MAKKKGPARGIGQIVQGEILPTIEIDFSDTIINPQEWTRGPVRPVIAVTSVETSKPGRTGEG